MASPVWRTYTRTSSASTLSTPASNRRSNSSELIGWPLFAAGRARGDEADFPLTEGESGRPDLALIVAVEDMAFFSLDGLTFAVTTSRSTPEFFRLGERDAVFQPVQAGFDRVEFKFKGHGAGCDTLPAGGN